MIGSEDGQETLPTRDARDPCRSGTAEQDDTGAAPGRPFAGGYRTADGVDASARLPDCKAVKVKPCLVIEARAQSEPVGLIETYTESEPIGATETRCLSEPRMMIEAQTESEPRCGIETFHRSEPMTKIETGMLSESRPQTET